MATYTIGIKAGLISGIITGVIFSIILSTLFYATMSNASPSFGTSEKTIAELAGFGKIEGNNSMDAAIFRIIAIMLGGSILIGVILGIATSATIAITKRGTSFSVTVLILLALSAYYYQKYDNLVNILEYAASETDINENLKLLMILTNIMPPIIFAAIESMLLNYFWGIYTVVNFTHTPIIKKEIPIQTNPVNATYNANAPVPIPQKSAQTSLLVKSLQMVPPPRPPQIQPAVQQPTQNSTLQKNIPNDLEEYILDCLNKGISEEEIISMFVGYGYDSEAIAELIYEKTGANTKS
ncbi:MAG: hypothetical protein ABIF85_06820 [Nanoarchaeota archaeon]|nr:hypothetical protein [Nanoarchaeota archaeon]MBU4452118.1 hypothetical protein [Nanoarchaeota archaeon]MCG2723685.1 hypothetical protein [archaeon]